MSRHNARDDLSLDDYCTDMEGSCSTSVSERTIDEAPGAYKPIDDIIGPIAESVDIVDVMGRSTTSRHRNALSDFVIYRRPVLEIIGDLYFRMNCVLNVIVAVFVKPGPLVALT